MEVDKQGLYRHLKLKPADQRLLDNIIETTSANHAREMSIGAMPWVAEKVRDRKLGYIKDMDKWRDWEVQEKTGEPTFITTDQLYTKYLETLNKEK